MTKPITPDFILTAVCEMLHIPIEEVYSRNKHEHVVVARSIFVYLARRNTQASFPAIARTINRPNHSTVVTAYARMCRRILRGTLVPDRRNRNPDTFVSIAELALWCEQAMRLRWDAACADPQATKPPPPPKPLLDPVPLRRALEAVLRLPAGSANFLSPAAAQAAVDLLRNFPEVRSLLMRSPRPSDLLTGRVA